MESEDYKWIHRPYLSDVTLRKTPMNDDDDDDERMNFNVA